MKGDSLWYRFLTQWPGLGLEVWHGSGDPIERGLRCCIASSSCAAEPGWGAEPSSSGAGGDLRRSSSFGCGAFCGGRVADHSGLGVALQLGRAGGLEGPQGSGSALQTERGATRGAGGGSGERSGPGDPRRGALASLRPGGMASRPVRRVVGSDDGRTGVASHGLCQAVCAPAPLCPGRRRPGGVQKNPPNA